MKISFPNMPNALKKELQEELNKAKLYDENGKVDHNAVITTLYNFKRKYHLPGNIIFKFGK